METNRGGLKSVDDLNYIYSIGRKYGEKRYRKCEYKECKARVHIKLEDDILYICKTVGEYCHPSHHFKPKVYEAKKGNDINSHQFTNLCMVLNCRGVSSLESNALALLPTLAALAHLSRSIRGWRQKESQDLPILGRRSGYIIPEEYTFLENGDQFALYDK